MRDKLHDRLLTRKELEEIKDEQKSALSSFYLPLEIKCPNLDYLIDYVKELPWNQEGYVIRYPHDLLVKIKSHAYIMAHRVIWMLNDNRIIEYLIDGKREELNAILDTVDSEISEQAKETMLKIERSAREHVEKIYTIFSQAPKNTRKEFAIWVNTNGSQFKKHLFNAFDNKPVTILDVYDRFSRGDLKWE
jgi:hypothetical protein